MNEKKYKNTSNQFTYCIEIKISFLPFYGEHDHSNNGHIRNKLAYGSGQPTFKLAQWPWIYFVDHSCFKWYN